METTDSGTPVEKSLDVLAIDRECSRDAGDLESALEKLGESVVFMDLRDLTGLAELHTGFEEIYDLAADKTNCTEFQQVVSIAIDLITRVILEELPDATNILSIIGDMVDYLQSIVRTGKASPIPAEWRHFEQPVLAGEAASGVAPSPDQPVSVNTYLGDPELLREFYQEAREHLELGEINLLALEAEPENAEAIAAVFRAFHTVKGAAGLLQLQSIQALSHVAESLLDKVRQGIIRMEGAVIDLSLEATDGLRRLIELQESGSAESDDASAKDWLDVLVAQIEAVVAEDAVPQRLGAILVEQGRATGVQIAKALEVQENTQPKPKLGEVLVANGSIPARDAVEALRTQNNQRRPASLQRDSIKVDADRLDLLVDLIGELVIAEAMVRQSEEVLEDPMSPLCRRLGQMDKITRELQTISMSLRMVPVRATFQKMARLIRDLAKNFGKEVDFVTEGEDTELDKNVVDQVADPLMHMIRNAIDHGIESPEDRVQQGKPAKARVLLRAHHEGGGIYIDIVDDGQGLDRDAILAKAVDRGLVQPGEVLADSEVWKLIFHPGLSTAKKVTDVSGRGVGMDVVQRNINALHGRIDVQSSPGVGSTFSIRLPLTLAIIDGMAISAGEERFILPIGNVVRATRPEPGEVHTVRGKGEVLRQHNRLIPLFRLHRLMDISNAIEDSEKGIVLVLEDNGRQIGLLADELIGQQQVVIKPLGKGIGTVAGLAGSAIMPDGRVGLILDTAGLFQSARQPEDGLHLPLEAS